MKLYCTECDQRLGSADELCPHRNPVGWCCCFDAHPFRPELEDIA